MVQILTASEMLSIGMTDLHDFYIDEDDVTLKANDSFRRLFGSGCDTVTQLRNDLVMEQKVKKSGPKFFLLTLLWLKSYRTELDLAVAYQRNERTLRTHFWFFVAGIQSLKDIKVRLLACEK